MNGGFFLPTVVSSYSSIESKTGIRNKFLVYCNNRLSLADNYQYKPTIKSMKSIRIATRNSPLALWQAHFIESKLKQSNPELEVQIIGMTTQGDKMLNRSLSKVGGKGLFMKELEQALLANEADIAVHSMKDVTVTLPEGLTIAAVCERENPHDAFVSNHYQSLQELPAGAKVGTSSLRRSSQLAHHFPELEIIGLRGNVNTRLSKLDNGEYDAIILAAAGLIRLQMNDRIKQYIPVEQSLPAVGQGIVGIECRQDDTPVIELLKALNNEESSICLEAERQMNAVLNGGCQVPIAGYAVLDQGEIWLRGLVAEVDGSRLLFEQMRAKTGQAADLGGKVAESLLLQGASAILEKIY